MCAFGEQKALGILNPSALMHYSVKDTNLEIGLEESDKVVVIQKITDNMQNIKDMTKILNKIRSNEKILNTSVQSNKIKKQIDLARNAS